MKLDHLVALAGDLDAGRAWMEARLGAPARGGGAHVGHGTRNALWRLGEAYLEVLAPDPDQPEPPAPRLFGLDLADWRARSADGPKLAAWVVSVDDLDAARAAMTVDPGAPRAMSRGALSWRLSVTPDGAPPAGGLVPALVEWPTADHPVAAMPEDGLRLEGLSGEEPDPGRALAARDALRTLGAEALIDVVGGPRARLTARIATPGGPVLLSG